MSKYSFANYFVSHVHVKKGKKFRKKRLQNMLSVKVNKEEILVGKIIWGDKKCEIGQYSLTQWKYV